MSSPNSGSISTDERKKPKRNLSDNNASSGPNSMSLIPRRDSRSQSVALGPGGAPGLVFDELSSSDEDTRSNASMRSDRPNSAREADNGMISAFEWLQRVALNDQIMNQSKIADTEDIELDLSISDLSDDESDLQLNENESAQSSTSHTPESSGSSNPLSNSQSPAENKATVNTKPATGPGPNTVPRLAGVSSALSVGLKGSQKSPRDSKDTLSAPSSARDKKSPRNSATKPVQPNKLKTSTKLKVKIPKAEKEDGSKLDAENEAKAIVMDGLKFVPNEEDLEKRLILGGSMEALVKALTSPTHHKDNTFAKEFLLTLHYFSTPLALMNMLVDRFEQRAPEGESDRKEFDQKKSFIQLRVIEVFQQWIETNFNDFRLLSKEGNNELVEKVLRFCDTDLKGSIHDKRFGFRDLMKRLIRYKMAGINKDCLDEVVVNMKHPDTGIKSTSKSKDTFAGTDMMKWFKKQLNLDEDDAIEVCNQLLVEGLLKLAKDTKTIDEPFKKSKKYSSNLTKEQEQLVVLRNLMPHNSDKPSSRGAKDFDPLNFAKQLTYFEFNLFKKISFREVNYWILGKKENREAEAPNLDAVVTFVNKVSSWVATEIVSAQSVKARQTLIKKFILMAQYCLKYKNYNGLLEIVGGLNNPSVKRLSLTWKTMNKKYTDILGKLSLIVSPEQNWKNYRPLMQNEAPPLVPYIGLFLADLTFINDGNPTKIDGSMINWKKMKKLSAILLQIQRAQQSQYTNIQPDPDAQAFLRQELFILDDKELFKRSRVLEPPEVAQSKK